MSLNATARGLGSLAVIFCTFAPLAAAPQRPAAPTTERATERGPVQEAPPAVRIVGDQDARQVREQFEQMLERQPPSLGRILKTDPSLMRNAAYMSTYPSVAAFLQEHPEIVNTPAYYFENISSVSYSRQPADPKSQAIDMWRDVLTGMALLTAFVTFVMALVWVLRTVFEYRRWSRVSRVQTDVHTKLLDRFTANEDLLAYMQTTPGRRFLESAPLSPDAPPRPVGAPLSRILWSVQVGIVLMMGAAGLLFVSMRVIEEVSQMLFAIGVLALAVGAGFVVSAVASFLLSRRLGLFEPVAAPHESTGA